MLSVFMVCVPGASIEKQYQQLAHRANISLLPSLCFSPARPSDVTLAAPQIQDKLRRMHTPNLFLFQDPAQSCVILRLPI
jgi:hypothetical protein